MSPRKIRVRAAGSEGRDPILDLIRRVGSEYTYGVLADGSDLEPADKVFERMVETFTEIAIKIAPNPANKYGGVSHTVLSACTGLKTRPGDLIYGKASTYIYRMAFVGFLAHLRGVKDTISDLEKLCLVGAQLSHDPRISRTSRLEGDKLGTRDKFKRRKRLREGKQPKHSVYLPLRLVSVGPSEGEAARRARDGETE